MRSKKSNHQKSPFLWKAESNSSESRLCELAIELSQKLTAGDRVLLEGPLGVGKTTFARSLLLGLGIEQPPEGSPTFAIAHEYESSQGGVVHIDFYRLKSETEIQDAGILSYYWERSLITVSEWLSAFPEFEKKVLQSGKIWRVELSYSIETPSLRNIRIFKIFF